jgi:hypothetical protein
MDNRIFFMSSLLGAKRALSNWFEQGHADYQSVYRPLIQSLGGSGYMQYAQILNTLTSEFGSGPMFQSEARITARINAGNFIRVAGRELGMDVRVGGSGESISNPVRPFVGQMVMAAYGNDPIAFRQAYVNAIQEAVETHGADARNFVQRTFQSYNPVRSVFKTAPTEGDFVRMLGTMNETGQHDVSMAVRLYRATKSVVLIALATLAAERCSGGIEVANEQIHEMD